MKKPFSPLHDVRHWLKYSPVVRMAAHHDTGLAKYRVSDGSANMLAAARHGLEVS
jgi:hypothetical protein